MNWLEMPPLSSLRAFSSFAKEGNVSRAGNALNVSHAAISQQIRSLEKHLDVALVDRSSRALELTDSGRHLAHALELGFGTIGDAVSDIGRAGATRPLHVSLTPSFAASWLMPRLAGFRAAHPEIDLTLDPSTELVQFRSGGVDLAIRYGTGDWPGVTSRLLLHSPMVIVAAPDLLEDREISSPQDLLQLPWLEELGTTEATNWLASQGVTLAPRAGRMRLPGNLILDAVRSGQGVTVTARHFVEPDIEAGRLVALFQGDRSDGYHIVTGPAHVRPVARAFIKWLLHQD